MEEEVKENSVQMYDFEGILYFPYKMAELSFQIREDYILNEFQMFLLEAINDGYAWEDIVEATMLTQYVVENELLQLVSQDLLKIVENEYILTEASERLISLPQIVKKLNEEQKIICINLVSGDIEEYDTEVFKNNDLSGASDECNLFLKRNISDSNLDGIGIDDNLEFLQQYMKTFSDMGDDDITYVLNAIIMEFRKIRDSIVYKKELITCLPCAIGNKKRERFEDEEETNICFKGMLWEMKLGYRNEKLDKKAELFETLKSREKNGEKLLCEEEELLLKYAEYQKYKEKPYMAYFDCSSGQISLEKIEEKLIEKKLVNTELPMKNADCEGVFRSAIEFVKSNFGIYSGEWDVLEKNQYEYYVKCHLEDLQGEGKC